MKTYFVVAYRKNDNWEYVRETPQPKNSIGNPRELPIKRFYDELVALHKAQKYDEYQVIKVNDKGYRILHLKEL